ncbi:MAG: DUF1611 domain-containing protein [Thermoplasmata archaeon]|nr:DUF1611 domain-containing protein [Thermoplasmata archaeon]
MENAVVYCEGKFGTSTGKTANGLVRYSRRFRIVGVIDSTKAGRDAGEVLDGVPKGIPVYSTLEEALATTENVKYFIVGVATIGGLLPQEYREIVKKAISQGMNVVSGLHEYLSEDREIAALAAEHGVKLIDVRKPRPLKEMQQFRNLSRGLGCLRIPVLGTDGSIGKRTTALIVTDALNSAGIKTVFVATGQTGLMQGSDYGVPLDSIKGDYMVGELEAEIVRAWMEKKPDVIVVEGQGSISHPAYVCGTRAIIMASQPTGIICQHAPKRGYRNFGRDTLKLPMPDLRKEIAMLEIFSDSKVFAITLNHENMTKEEIEEYVKIYERDFGLPCCDVLVHGAAKIVEAIKGML